MEIHTPITAHLFRGQQVWFKVKVGQDWILNPIYDYYRCQVSIILEGDYYVFNNDKSATTWKLKAHQFFIEKGRICFTD